MAWWQKVCHDVKSLPWSQKYIMMPMTSKIRFQNILFPKWWQKCQDNKKLVMQYVNNLPWSKEHTMTLKSSPWRQKVLHGVKIIWRSITILIVSVFRIPDHNRSQNTQYKFLTYKTQLIDTKCQWCQWIINANVSLYAYEIRIIYKFRTYCCMLCLTYSDTTRKCSWLIFIEVNQKALELTYTKIQLVHKTYISTHTHTYV